MTVIFNSTDLKQLIGGDQAVFKRIYDQYSDRIFRYALSFVKDDAWAEEILQDTFLKLWNSRSLLDPTGDIWLYLYVLCKRFCLSRLREIKRSKELQERFFLSIEYEQLHHLDTLEVKDLESFISRVIEILPPRQQEIFHLSRVEGLTHKEIAEKLGISSNTVKNHMVSALKAIRLELDKNDYKYFIILSFSVLCF